MATGGRSVLREQSLFSKLSSAISKTFKRLTGVYDGQIRTGKSHMDMPALQLASLQRSVMACCTGPYGGLCQLDPEKDSPTHDRDIPVAGVIHWYRPKPQADGQSITLYEHKPSSTQHHGDPIADVYAVVARPNSCIIVVADGVNWGIKPRLAARCAVHGCVDHLNSKLFNCPKIPVTTQDVFHDILRSFCSAQEMIIQRGGTTTTLCVATVVELQDPKAGSQWGLCVVSVGDSLCYVWKSEEQEVFEVTSEMHLGQERNPRDCGGCLGCDLGDRPDLSNLTCCFVPLTEDDVVFVTSDGIVDNFDPVILRDAVSLSQHSTPTTPSAAQLSFLPTQTQDSDVSGGVDPSPTNALSVPQGTQLPVVDIEERQHLLLEKLTKLLREKVAMVQRKLSATDVKEALINHVIEVTEDKRRYLEQCWTELDKPDLSTSEKRANDRKISQHIKLLPGKLDHATVAAYCVGKLVRTEGGVSARTGGAPTHSYAMNNVVQAADSAEQRVGNSSSAGGSVFYSLVSHTGEHPTSSSRRTVMHAHSEDVCGFVDNDESKETKSGRERRTGFLRTLSDRTPARIERQEALLSYPECFDDRPDSFLYVD